MEMDSPTVLEARSLSSKCQQGHTSSESSREDSILSLFQLLVGDGNFLTCVSIASFSVSLAILLPSYRDRRELRVYGARSKASWSLGPSITKYHTLGVL